LYSDSTVKVCFVLLKAFKKKKRSSMMIIILWWFQSFTGGKWLLKYHVNAFSLVRTWYKFKLTDNKKNIVSKCITILLAKYIYSLYLGIYAYFTKDHQNNPRLPYVVTVSCLLNQEHEFSCTQVMTTLPDMILV
jgi:membrane-associated HD superfamily phosphohydrolase